MVGLEILLATAGSLEAKKAERTALRITKLYNLRMAALLVVNVMSAHPVSEMNRAIKHGEQVLDEVAAEDIKIGVDVRKILRIGRIGDTILRVAKNLGVHIIVLGPENRKRMRILLGSVNGKVVRNADCTVLVVR